MKQASNIKKLIIYLRNSGPLIFSHHPDCSYFKNDYYRVFNLKLCRGCFTSYPVALFVIALHFFGFIDLSFGKYIFYGIMAGTFQFLSFTNITDNSFVKLIVKVFMGTGIGMVTIGIFISPFPFIIRLLMFILCVYVAGYLSYFRVKKIKKICSRCEWGGNWDECPGFKEVLEKLKSALSEEGLLSDY